MRLVVVEAGLMSQFEDRPDLGRIEKIKNAGGARVVGMNVKQKVGLSVLVLTSLPPRT